MRIYWLQRIYDRLVSGLLVTQEEKDRTITGDVNVTQDAKDRTITGDVNVTQDAKDRTITAIPDVELDPFDTLLSSSVTLTTANTAYLLPASAQSGRRMLVVYNNTGHDLFIGHSGVTTSNGLTVADEKHIVIGASGGVYAVCGTASVTVRILELK